MSSSATSPASAGAISYPGSPGSSRARGAARRGIGRALPRLDDRARGRGVLLRSSRVPRRPRSPRPTAEPACRSTGSSRPCSFNPTTGAMKCLSPRPSRRPTGPAGRVCWRDSRRSSPGGGRRVGDCTSQPRPPSAPPSHGDAGVGTAVADTAGASVRARHRVVESRPAARRVRHRADTVTDGRREQHLGADCHDVASGAADPARLRPRSLLARGTWFQWQLWACEHATSKERGYAQAIAGMSRSKQAAAFGTEVSGTGNGSITRS